MGHTGCIMGVGLGKVKGSQVRAMPSVRVGFRYVHCTMYIVYIMHRYKHM